MYSWELPDCMAETLEDGMGVEVRRMGNTLTLILHDFVLIDCFGVVYSVVSRLMHLVDSPF